MKKSVYLLTAICLVFAAFLAGCASSADTSLADKLENVKVEPAKEKEPEKEEKQAKEEEPDEEEEPAKEEEPEKEDKTDYEELYAPVFDEVKDVLVNGFDFDRQYDYISDGLMERVMYPGEEDLLDDVGYMLEDISGDGIPELMIGYNDSFDESEPERSYVLSVFTLSDDKVVTVFSGWARNRYWPLPDGHFYNCGSGGASNTEFGENHLSKDGTEVVWDDFYFSEEDASGQIVYFHNTTGIWDRAESDKADMTDNEFWDLMEEYEGRCILFTWTPMREK